MEKKIPERMCVCCRNSYPKQALLRIVRTPGGEVLIDESGKASGRGAYLCKERACANRMLKSKPLSRILGAEVPDSLYEILREALLG